MALFHLRNIKSQSWHWSDAFRLSIGCAWQHGSDAYNQASLELIYLTCSSIRGAGRRHYYSLLMLMLIIEYQNWYLYVGVASVKGSLFIIRYVFLRIRRTYKAGLRDSLKQHFVQPKWSYWALQPHIPLYKYICTSISINGSTFICRDLLASNLIALRNCWSDEFVQQEHFKHLMH